MFNSASKSVTGLAIAQLPPAEVRVDVDDLIALRRSARSLSLPGRRAPGSILAGNHRSPLRGRGMDYLESRHYQPGDDVRSMDWRVTARAGQPHVKVYHEERERPVVLMVDFNPSMFFGTRGSFKSVTAARAAALLAWAAIGRGDRVGGLLFNGEHRELPPRGGRRGVMALIEALISSGDPDYGLSTDPAAGMADALHRLRRVAHPGSLIYLISDFYAIDGADGDCARHLLQLRRHCDVIACQVVDPLEMAPPPAGRYGVGDRDNRAGVLDTRSLAGRSAYQQYLQQHHHEVRVLTADQGVSLLQLHTEDDVATQLAGHRNLLPVVGGGLAS
jgi:uncharacterized protein (DUF58 family)